MPVDHISVSISRRVQLKEYEPYEGKVEVAYALVEGDDPQVVMQDAVRSVKEGLGLCFKSSDKAEAKAEKPKPVAAPAPAEEAPKKSRGRPKKPVDPEPADTSTVPDDDDFGDAPSEPEIEKDDDGINTPVELQRWLMTLIQTHAVDGNFVRNNILKNYGVTRTLDLSPEDVAKVKGEVKKLVKENEAAAI